MYAISHTHDVCDFSYTKVCMRILIQIKSMLIFQVLFENVCEFSYKGARQKLLYAISHTKNVCDFSYMMDDEPGLRPAFCGVPAAGCRGGEGQAEMRPFTNGKAANLRRSRRESAGRGRGLFRPVVHNFKENRR